MEMEMFLCHRFLVVSEVPELFRRLREACGKNSLQVSSKSALVPPSCPSTESMKRAGRPQPGGRISVAILVLPPLVLGYVLSLFASLLNLFHCFFKAVVFCLENAI